MSESRKNLAVVSRADPCMFVQKAGKAELKGYNVSKGRPTKAIPVTTTSPPLKNEE